MSLIEINLAPESETDNKFWFVLDLIVVFLCFFITDALTKSYTDSLKDEINTIKKETRFLRKDTKNLKRDILRFDDIERQIQDLKVKIATVENLTESTFDRFRPIAVIELLENMKPEGVWFSGLYYDTKNMQIYINGGTFDYEFIAIFMDNLKSLKFQEIEDIDMRTRLFFSEVFLEHTAVSVQKKVEKKRKHLNQKY